MIQYFQPDLFDILLHLGHVMAHAEHLKAHAQGFQDDVQLEEIDEKQYGGEGDCWFFEFLNDRLELGKAVKFW